MSSAVLVARSNWQQGLSRASTRLAWSSTPVAAPPARARALGATTAPSPGGKALIPALERARHPRHVVLDEEEVEHHHRQAAEERARHQRAPLIDVAPHQLGGQPDGNGLVL